MTHHVANLAYVALAAQAQAQAQALITTSSSTARQNRQLGMHHTDEPLCGEGPTFARCAPTTNEWQIYNRCKLFIKTLN